jgi:hypothetical protein
MHDRTGPQVGVAVIDTDDSRRTVARTEDPAVMAAMAAEEWLRRRVYVDNLRFTVAAD